MVNVQVDFLVLDLLKPVMNYSSVQLLILDRYSLVSEGPNASDPWGVREDPEELKGVANDDIRIQQQQIIKGN